MVPVAENDSLQGANARRKSASSNGESRSERSGPQRTMIETESVPRAGTTRLCQGVDIVGEAGRW
jgi:hypothetical protein